jgi:hypothetical protein
MGSATWRYGARKKPAGTTMPNEQITRGSLAAPKARDATQWEILKTGLVTTSF